MQVSSSCGGRPLLLARRHAVLLALLWLAAPGQSSLAQAKTLTPTGGTELEPTPVIVPAQLPATRQVWTQQMPSACVVVGWDPVPGARSYNLGRSLGTNGYQRVTDVAPGPSTLYYDSHVQAGVRVSYTVTAVDSTGRAGLRATSRDFIPQETPPPAVNCAAAPVVAPPANVVATKSANGVLVQWTGRSEIARYEVTHLVDGGIVGINTSTINTLSFPLAVGSHRFDVVAVDYKGVMSQAGSSNTLVLQASDIAPTDPPAGGSGGSGGGTSLSAPQTAELSFAVSTAITLRAGATSRGTAPAGSQWLSLDPAVASVNADGTIKARAAGEARVVALSPSGSGGIRVTVVRVVVTP